LNVNVKSFAQARSAVAGLKEGGKLGSCPGASTTKGPPQKIYDISFLHFLKLYFLFFYLIYLFIIYFLLLLFFNCYLFYYLLYIIFSYFYFLCLQFVFLI